MSQVPVSFKTAAPYHHGEHRAMSAEKEASLEENAKTASCFLWSLLGEELTLVFKSRNLDL